MSPRRLNVAEDRAWLMIECRQKLAKVLVSLWWNSWNSWMKEWWSNRRMGENEGSRHRRHRGWFLGCQPRFVLARAGVIQRQRRVVKECGEKDDKLFEEEGKMKVG